MPAPEQEENRWAMGRRYALALAVTAVALGLRAGLGASLGPQAPMLLPFIGVVFAAWWGGFGPGLAGLLVSTVVGLFFFVEPAGVWLPQTLADWVRMAIFVGGGVLICVLVGSRTQAMRQAAAGEAVRRRSEESFRLLVESVTDYAIYLLDPSGRIVSWNAGAERLNGYAESEVLGQSFGMHFPAEDQAAGLPQQLLERAIKDGTSRQEGWRMRKGGGRFFAQVTLTALRSPTGELRGFAKVTRDVTQEREAMRTLAASESRARGVLEAALDGVMLIDDRGTIDSLNPAAEELFGYPADQLVGQNVKMLMPQPDRAQHDSYLAAHRVTGVRRIIGRGRETFGQKKDGTVFPIELAVSEVRLPDGRHMFAGIIRDVTERNAAQLVLHETQERYRRLVEISPDAVLVNQGGRIVFANEAALLMFRGPRERLLGRPPLDLICAESKDLVEQRIAQLQRSPDPVPPIEQCWQRLDGTEIYVESVAAPITWEGGKPAILILLRDISERRRARLEREQFLRQLQEEKDTLEVRVRERTAELEAFSYSVAHDLRAPLRGMRGFAQALLQDYGSVLPPEGRAFCERITGAGQRMEELIEDLLTYSRMSREEVQLRPVHLRSAVDDALHLVARDVAERGATITVDPDLPVVVAAPTLLVRMIQNLLSNAVKFTAKGVMPVVRVGAEDRGARVRLSVTDNGIGVAPEHQEKIFGVFERLHTTDRYPGTGIGLAIVRRGAERQQGAAGVESSPTAGSTFWIELPKPPMS